MISATIDSARNVSAGTPTVPNGTPITIIPDVLTVYYDSSTTSTSGSVQVSVELLGNTVDTLDGTCSWNSPSAVMTEQFDIKVLGFELIGGSFSLSADTTGLKGSGDLRWLGHDVDLGNGYLVKWP